MLKHYGGRKFKKELTYILKTLKNKTFMGGTGKEMEDACKHVLVSYECDYPPNYFEEKEFLQFETNNRQGVLTYYCPNCGAVFARNKDKTKVFSFVHIGGKYKIGNTIDINKIPIINVINNSFIIYKNLFKNQNSILYLRTISQLGIMLQQKIFQDLWVSLIMRIITNLMLFIRIQKTK